MDPTKDHHRVSPEGRQFGEHMARLADKACLVMAREGDEDTRCKSCALRLGTVPNGCLQTQMDVAKAISENVPFMCHQHMRDGQPTTGCHGWFAVSVLARRFEEDTGLTLPPCNWEFSPPDPVK